MLIARTTTFTESRGVNEPFSKRVARDFGATFCYVAIRVIAFHGVDGWLGGCPRTPFPPVSIVPHRSGRIKSIPHGKFDRAPIDRAPIVRATFVPKCKTANLCQFKRIG